MKKTGKIIAIIVVLALVVSGVFLFAGGRKNTAYREEIARTQDISTYYTFSGNLSTKDSQIVTSTAKTTVKECLFSEGDAVKKNDIILKFSSGGTARAPMDGTLSNLYVEEGDEVTMGQQLLRVADYSNPQIVFNVDEYDRPALSVGQAADVTVLSTTLRMLLAVQGAHRHHHPHCAGSDRIRRLGVLRGDDDRAAGRNARHGLELRNPRAVPEREKRHYCVN